MSVNRKYWFTTVLLSLFIIISGCAKTHIAKEKEQKTGSIVVESNNTNSSYTEEKIMQMVHIMKIQVILIIIVLTKVLRKMKL